MKIIPALVMAIIFPVTLCTTAFASSKNSEPIVLTMEQFTEFVMTGKVTKPVLCFAPNNSICTAYTSVLDIDSKNQLFWIRTEAMSLDRDNGCDKIKALQPARIIDGVLLVVDYARKQLPETQEIKVVNGVADLVEFALIQPFYFAMLTGKLINYPSFPIVFRTSEAEKLSLLHITYMFNSVSAELIAQGQKQKLNSDNFKLITDELMQIPERMPNDLCRLITIINNEKRWDFDNDMRAFTLDKEKLFYTMRRLHEARRDFNYQAFFKEILKIDGDLTDVYDKATVSSVKNANTQRIKEIKKALSQKDDIKLRNNMAKALLLDVFCYVENPLFDIETNVKLITKNVHTVLYTKYGQMARLVKHMEPHVKSKKEKIPLIPAKSLFVLKTDAKIEDFYKVLCDSIIEDALSNSDSKQVHKTYEINDVQVDEKKNNKDKSTITLIITLTDKNVDELIDKMFSTDGIGNIKRTNKIKCVLEEDCGSFDLKTIYPTMDTKQYYFTNRNNNVIKEDKSEIYKLYNETFLPERLQAKNSKSLNVLRVDV